MIRFKKIRYQNLLSTGNQFTEILLDKSKSTLIVGANGSGKSTFIEALTFVLYGKPFRDINKPKLLNTITNKNLLVELEFEIGDKKYLIRRGMKPDIFEIFVNEVLIPQPAKTVEYQEDLEKNILKMNFKSFTQIVVLGSANYVPFMQLDSKDRSKVVEDILDIQVFSIMNSILKTKRDANKEEITEVEHKIRLCEQKIELHNKHIQSLKVSNDILIEEKKVLIAEKELAVQEYEAECCILNVKITDLLTKVGDYDSVVNRKTKLLKYESSFEEKLRILRNDYMFFKDNDSCPTCKQGLAHEHKNEKMESGKAQAQKLKEGMAKLEEEILRTNQRLSEINALNVEINKLSSELSSIQQQIRFTNKYITDLNAEITSLNNKSAAMEQDSTDIETYQKDLSRMKVEYEALLKQKTMYELAGNLLKDTGIKKRIIKQYVPIMNRFINKYLAAMDFFVHFELDESFKESIKSRHRDEFTYESFSEGEKMRIDLALMFTWRAIAKMRNSAATNLLILDEVFDSSLDNNGTDEFFKILESFTDDTNTFVISHRGDQLFDRFHSVIKFEKNTNFSRMVI